MGWTLSGKRCTYRPTTYLTDDWSGLPCRGVGTLPLKHEKVERQGVTLTNVGDYFTRSLLVRLFCDYNCPL